MAPTTRSMKAEASITMAKAAPSTQHDAAQEELDDELEYAAYDGDVDEMEKLLSRGARVTEVVVAGASTIDEVGVWEILLGTGWDPNTLTGDSVPLRFCKKEETIRLLLDRGAEIDLAGPNGYTALKTAVMDDTTEIAALLVSLGASVGSDLFCTAMRGSGDRAAMLNFLVEAGADIDGYDDELGTPLHTAIDADQAWWVRRLLETGADPFRVADHGRYANVSPAEMSRTCLNDDIIELFDEHIAALPPSKRPVGW